MFLFPCVGISSETVDLSFEAVSASIWSYPTEQRRERENKPICIVLFWAAVFPPVSGRGRVDHLEIRFIFFQQPEPNQSLFWRLFLSIKKIERSEILRKQYGFFRRKNSNSSLEGFRISLTLDPYCFLSFSFYFIYFSYTEQRHPLQMFQL